MDTKALRQKILDLAIRGKLVPQDPNDEPASVLLDRIHAEKQQMVKDGKLKPKDIKNDTVIFKGDDNLHYERFSDGTVKCIEDEIPFDIPDGWSWTRLITICPYGETTTINANNITDNEWILELEDIEKDTGKILSYVLKSERQSVSQKHKFCKGQLLYSKLRPYLNKVLIAPKDGYCTSEILPLTLYGNISPEYIRTFLMSDTFLAYVDLISYGVKMPRLGTEDGKRSLIALPPLQEQFRIDTKLQESLEKIEYLKLHSNESEKIIKTIKSKILDLAIRGKLVTQDPNDEPASALLERIRSEKEELIKQGKIKRNKKESVIFKGSDNSYYEKIGNDITCIDDEIPFDIPNTWSWTRISTIADITMGSSPKSQYICNDNQYIEFHQGKIYFSKKTLMKSNQYTRKTTKLAPKQSVLLCVRAPVGELNITDRNICIGRGLASIKSLGNINEEFIFYWLHPYKIYLVNQSTGSTFSSITSDTVRNILMPLPPLKEQKEILNKIQKVFTLLEDLETVN